MTAPDARLRPSGAVRTLWPCSEASASVPASASVCRSDRTAPALVSARGDGADTPGRLSVGVSPDSVDLLPADPAARRSGAAEEASGSPIAVGEPVATAELLDTVPARLETLPGLSKRQRASYPRWATLYLRQLSWQDRSPSAEAIEAFIDRLKQRGVEESKRLMAQEALIFLHDVVLGIPSVIRKQKEPQTSEELPSAVQKAVIAQLSGPSRLMARLAFATGMTPREAACIRTGDVTLGQEGTAGTVVVRDENGRCDRIVDINADLADALRVQLQRVRSQYDRDREERFAGAPLPPQIEAVFPEAGNGWEWQFVFPSERREVNDETGEETRPCMGADHFTATIEAILKAETHVIKLED